MPLNFKFAYRRRGGKHVFVPNDEATRRGETLIRYCGEHIQFPDYFFHYRSGGHVAALHEHLQNNFFFRIDIENFFYSVSRNRVTAALHSTGFHRARTYAQWSCVKNPVAGPRYSLPIGFVQSPILASLCIMRSPLADVIEAAKQSGVLISIYFDDFIGSAKERAPLEEVYESLLLTCDAANFTANAAKLLTPREEIEAFNCRLTRGVAEVTPARIAQFLETGADGHAASAFDDYCSRVAALN
jgi:hypothetical protein